MKREDIRRIWKACDRFLTVFLSHVLISQVLYFYPKFFAIDDLAETFWERNFTTIICLVLMVPLFYSLVKVTTIFDEPLRGKFFSVEMLKCCFKEKLMFLFRQKRFWIEIAAFVLLYLMLPLKWSYAALLDLFLKNNASFGGKLMLLAVLFPLFFAANILARLSAMKHWRSYKPEEPQPNAKKKNPEKAYNTAMATTAIAYGVVGVGLTVLIPMLSNYLPFLKEVLTPTVIVVLFMLIALCFGIRFGRAFCKRRAFIKRLTAVCKEKRGEASEISCPYRSLFSMYDGESFHVKIGEKRYSCKFISATKKNIPLVLHAEGICQFIHSIHFAGVELYRYAKTYVFGYEAEGRKILIISPVPKRVCNSRMELLDNGDMVGEYKIFTGTAFLNALERECIDR